MKADVSLLKKRSAMLQKARNFFYERAMTEVDCPLLSPFASIDAHIDLIETSDGRFLHSSPEYGMKRLLAEGIGDIFQLSHVFRKEEVGKRHNPEFMLAEWYRIGVPFEAMIEETALFIALFLGPMSLEKLSYKEAFLKYAKMDPFSASKEDLLKIARKCNPYPEIEKEGRDGLLNLILAEMIEPKLGQDQLTALYGYPQSQAALAKVSLEDGVLCSQRFEIYFQGIELCNGYAELIDANEQKERLLMANCEREALGKKRVPLDIHFLEALKKGIPECCGVAVGFDRLLALQNQKETLAEVLPFPWDLA